MLSSEIANLVNVSVPAKSGNNLAPMVKSEEISLCAKCKKRPIRVKSRSLCGSCATNFYMKRKEEKRLKGNSDLPSWLQLLLPKARRIVARKAKATTELLRNELHVKFETAVTLLKILQEEGLIESYTKDSMGRTAYRVRTQIQVSTEISVQAVQRQLTTSEKVTGIEELLAILGEKSRPASLLRAVIGDLLHLERIKDAVL